MSLMPLTQENVNRKVQELKNLPQDQLVVVQDQLRNDFVGYLRNNFEMERNTQAALDRLTDSEKEAMGAVSAIGIRKETIFNPTFPTTFPPEGSAAKCKRTVGVETEHDWATGHTTTKASFSIEF